MSEPNKAWIQTYTGRRFFPLAPRVEDIEVRDIAHALSLQCRFSGQIKQHYSVAQHSVYVSRECDPADARWGLLHDAAEAYLVDLPRPIKHALGFADVYRETEERLMRAICERFGLPEAEPASVKEADNLMLATEAHRLFATPLLTGWEKWGPPDPDIRIERWTPELAEFFYLSRFHLLDPAEDCGKIEPPSPKELEVSSCPGLVRV